LIDESTRISSREPPYLHKLSGFFDKLFHDPVHHGYATYAAVSDDYFRVLGIPLLRGRLFDARDAADAPHVTIISDAVAKKRWPNQDPLGQTIEFGNIDGDLRLLTIVGIVGDIRGDSLEEPRQPTIYVNLRQRPQRANPFTVAMRTTADAGMTLSSARKIVNELDPDIPPKSNTFTEVVRASLHARRFNLILVGLFALTALLLAVAGIYGVLAYSVARRTREVGVRIALGATVGQVFKLILGQAVQTALAGVVVGLAAAFVLTRTMRSLLFETSASDPMTFAAVAVLLILVATVASFIPAHRATKVDPMVALRHD
jgi:predicted permease